jgi:Tol biopolymer transport system component
MIAKLTAAACIVAAAALTTVAAANPGAPKQPSHAAAPKRAGTIAFIRLFPGPVFGGRLFVVRPDGSGLRGVTPLTTKVFSYAWSPDGRLIAYIDRRFSLWLVHPDGTGRRLLLPTSRLSSVALSWSPDGKEIAVVSPGANVREAGCGTTLYVVPIDGAPPRSLVSRSAGCDVAWSPRGDEIAYDGDGAIQVIRADGTGRRQVVYYGGGGPQWSADGSQLAFNVVIHLRNGFTGRYQAFGVVGADGKHFHVVTTHAYTEYGVAWSPSGRRILYGRADRKGIYVIGADGRNNQMVTRDSPPQALWGALAWSPDGGSIVYATDRTGSGDLYVIGVDGRGKVQVTNTPDTDIDPSWVAR